MASTAASTMRWLAGLVWLIALSLSAQVTPAPAEIEAPDMDPILRHLEETQDPTRFRQFQVTRAYKVFSGDNPQPASEVTARIKFVPPDIWTYQVTEAKGSGIAEKMIRELLDREIESGKRRRGSNITRANYDFIFLRRENFGQIPEYVLGIVPKRKDKFLLRGEIWVDASTFRIRRIEGVPAKIPSFWIKNIHITLQLAELGGMWMPVTFDAVGTVRFVGQYTLAGVTIPETDPQLSAPK